VVRENRNLHRFAPGLKSAGISLAHVEVEKNINSAVAKTAEPVTASAFV
jgi:hypothetical protein